MAARSRGAVSRWVLLAVLLGQVVWAGDSDGVTGYSIRLKNKDFTTGDDVGGMQGGSAVYAIPKSQEQMGPNTVPVYKVDYIWLSVPFRFALFGLFIR